MAGADTNQIVVKNEEIFDLRNKINGMACLIRPSRHRSKLFFFFFNPGDLFGQLLLLFQVALTGNHDALCLG